MPRTYELHHVNRLGHELVHELVTDDTLAPGGIIRSEGRDWIVDRLDGSRVFLEPARYRLVLRFPEGEMEPGAFRRYRPDAPRSGHTFSTIVDGAPVVWGVVDEVARYIDALIIEEIEDDLLVLCGVNPDRDPPETWIETVRERLRADLEGFRVDIEGDHDEIEEWDFRDGKVFAASGTFDDQSNADSGFGWMARLVDASAAAAGGLTRVRQADLDR